MKYIIAICLLAFGLTACNNAPKKEDKIDFTKSYETAAMALTDAQLAYDAAVASNDTARISAAKVELEAAKTIYLQSKTTYMENGGIAKSEYEQLLEKTNTALGKAPNDTTTAAIKPGVDLARAPITAATKILDSGVTRANKRVQQVSDAVTTGEKQFKQTVAKANENLVKATDSTKKRIDELKRQTNALKNLFKRNADTSKQN